MNLSFKGLVNLMTIPENHPENNKKQKGQRGFSLIEILIALTLLGFIGTFVAGEIFDQLYEGKVKATNIQMNSFKSRLQEFRRKCGFYPTTDQGLEALISEPTSGRECRNYPPNGFIDGRQIPLDPWDNPYVYESNGKEFNISSYGADLAPGGEGKDKDIYLYEQQGNSAGNNQARR